MEKVVYSEIKLGFPFIVCHLVYKFQKICLRGTYVIEQKPNVGYCFESCWTWSEQVKNDHFERGYRGFQPFSLISIILFSYQDHPCLFEAILKSILV
jgi:hypothetical protein